MLGTGDRGGGTTEKWSQVMRPKCVASGGREAGKEHTKNVNDNSVEALEGFRLLLRRFWPLCVEACEVRGTMLSVGGQGCGRQGTRPTWGHKVALFQLNVQRGGGRHRKKGEGKN